MLAVGSLVTMSRVRADANRQAQLGIMMVTNPITRLEDARALKKMGMSVHMPVKTHFFSEEYSRHWINLQNAHTKFMIAVNEYSDSPRAGSLGKWRLIERRLAILGNELLRCDAFICELLGGEAMSKVHLRTASEQDQEEAQFLAHFLTERAMPFVEFWQHALDNVVDDGDTVIIEPSDIPPWLDVQ